MTEALLRLRDVPEWIARRRGLPFEERIEQASAAFLGLPYKDDAVGEGRTGAFDRRPVFRLDGFDCHTYVEISLALAAARSGREFRALVRALRYREGKVDFSTRNHLTLSQWVPHNLAAGLVRNVTSTVAGDEPTQQVARKFDVGIWFTQLGSARLHGFRDSPAEREEHLHRLRHAWTGPRWTTIESVTLPFSALVRTGDPYPGGANLRGLQVNLPLLERFPRGAILIIWSNAWIHMVLAISRRGEWVVRHANRSLQQIAEHPLAPFLFNLTHFGKGHSLMVLEPVLNRRED